MNVEYEFKVNNITYMNFDMGFEEVSDTMPVVVCFPVKLHIDIFLEKDYNKSITEISYNVLNLLQTLKISSATNTYTYAADRRKLKTAHTICT